MRSPRSKTSLDGNSPNINSTRFILRITFLQLLHLLLCLFGIGNLGNWLFGIVALIAGLIFVTAALKAPDESGSLVILDVIDLLFTLLGLGSVNVEFLVVRLLRGLLYLLGLGCGLANFGGSRLLCSRCGGGLVLLRLLGDGPLRCSWGRLLILFVTEEIGGALAGLHLASGGTIGLCTRLGLGLFRLGNVILLLQNGLGSGIFGDLGGFGRDLLGFFRGRVTCGRRS